MLQFEACSVHEGILAVDVDGRITLTNTAAHALLDQAGLDTPTLGTPITDYLPQSGLPAVLRHGQASLDTGEQRWVGHTSLGRLLPRWLRRW